MRAFLDRIRPFAPLTLRLTIAAVFCVYGARLVFKEMGPFITAVQGWGFPKWMGYTAAWSALVGGALIGIGFLTRLMAFLCLAFTTLILIKTKLHAGWQGGLDLPILAMGGLASLVLSGAGKWSFDHKLFTRGAPPA